MHPFLAFSLRVGTLGPLIALSAQLTFGTPVLFKADFQCELFVDGQRIGSFADVDILRAQLVPGEHLIQCRGASAFGLNGIPAKFAGGEVKSVLVPTHFASQMVTVSGDEQRVLTLQLIDGEISLAAMRALGLTEILASVQVCGDLSGILVTGGGTTGCATFYDDNGQDVSPQGVPSLVIPGDESSRKAVCNRCSVVLTIYVNDQRVFGEMQTVKVHSLYGNFWLAVARRLGPLESPWGRYGPYLKSKLINFWIVP